MLSGPHFFHDGKVGRMVGIVPSMRWKGNDLYLGLIYVGNVCRVVPENWRSFECFSSDPKPDTSGLSRANVANRMAYYTRQESKPWRIFLMTSEEGDTLGFEATEEDARAALETMVMKAVSGNNQK